MAGFVTKRLCLHLKMSGGAGVVWNVCYFSLGKFNENMQLSPNIVSFCGLIQFGFHAYKQLQKQ